jgi:pimeloyl-ACP methyl ester carboxylesterase
MQESSVMWGHSRLDVGLPHRQAELFSAAAPRGVVVFAHGDTSNRHGWRSTEVAQTLQRRGLSALLVDLLSEQESGDKEMPYDIDLLAGRLLHALERLPPSAGDQPLGLFGSDTGAAAAIVAAVRRPRGVRALVSRGGRPDLAGDALSALRVPTLLIVGAADADVVAANRRAYLALRCEKRIELVPRATHLFLEAGTLDQVTRLAGDWLMNHLTRH